jgi:DNA-binding NarL/FixJ family response regulator
LRRSAAASRQMQNLQNPDPRPAQTALVRLLSPREREVLAAIHSGLPDKAIAADLGITHATVRTYCKVIFGKLSVHSRVGAALLWERSRAR